MNDKIKLAEIVVREIKIDLYNEQASLAELHAAEDFLDAIYLEEVKRMALLNQTIHEIAIQVDATDESIRDYCRHFRIKVRDLQEGA